MAEITEESRQIGRGCVVVAFRFGSRGRTSVGGVFLTQNVSCLPSFSTSGVRERVVVVVQAVE
jgi:hypothetical protein